MSVLVYLESHEGSFQKNTKELASYAADLAASLGVEAIGVAINNQDALSINPCGLHKILNVSDTLLSSFSAKLYSEVISSAVEKTGATTIILSTSANSKYLAGLLAAKIEAAVIPNVVSLPKELNGQTVYKRTVFTNKGFCYTASNSPKTLITLSKNSYGITEQSHTASLEELSVNSVEDRVRIESSTLAKGTVSIADADIVVSAGRGLKGPENWGMIEELAQVLGAATACSKPVSDLGWRPHSEHVGQTGKPVATNLYFAIGISGAIQHLAGINASKVKVVINNDPEAPFFKAADYGVVGDAFAIVPELIQKFKDFKAQNG